MKNFQLLAVTFLFAIAGTSFVIEAKCTPGFSEAPNRGGCHPNCKKGYHLDHGGKCLKNCAKGYFESRNGVCHHNPAAPVKPVIPSSPSTPPSPSVVNNQLADPVTIDFGNGTTALLAGNEGTPSFFNVPAGVRLVAVTDSVPSSSNQISDATIPATFTLPIRSIGMTYIITTDSNGDLTIITA
ncbi:MAG: hypothetical protein JO129_03660 [Candidatus Dependentiae bacterium]|nr:hypothetical protein [Candidatus Dependentiae bacterium]